MKLKLTVFLVLITYLLTSCGNRKMKKDLSIKAVVGQFIHELYEDDKLEMFVFSLPSQAVVPDHFTGPRVLVFLTDLKANRLDDGDEIQAAKDQVFYLTNDFSKGFVNSAKEAAYLVLSFKQEGLVGITDLICQGQGLEQLYSQGGLLICKNELEQTLKFDNRVFIYNPRECELNIVKAGEEILMNAEDLLFKLQGL